jgi:hypothetical protein
LIFSKAFAPFLLCIFTVTISKQQAAIIFLSHVHPLLFILKIGRPISITKSTERISGPRRCPTRKLSPTHNVYSGIGAAGCFFLHSAADIPREGNI